MLKEKAQAYCTGKAAWGFPTLFSDVWAGMMSYLNGYDIIF
ncbi:hypothetical protein HMPREF9419_0171 [Prevotella nigrescens ATCC 33563]|nr:hypothetical protein HMPREF9419_0171 [Prevotella nigrescens ATCC 33563]